MGSLLDDIDDIIDDGDVGDGAVGKEQTGDEQDCRVGQIGYKLHGRLDEGTDRLRLVEDRAEQIVLLSEFLHLFVLGVERLDDELTGIVFFNGRVDFTEQLLVFVEQRQGKLEGETDDDQHDGQRRNDHKRHLPAGDKHRREHADQHNAGLHQHAHGVLQRGAEDIDVVGDNGEDITGLGGVKVVERHFVDF